MTPSLPQHSVVHHKKKKTQLAIFASTLIASSLASNAESHSVLKPKRRPSKAPPTQKVFPPLKRSHSSSVVMHSSLSCSNQVFKFTSDFKFHLESSEFSTTAMLTSDESKVNKFKCIKKKIDNLKKRIDILEAKLKDRKVEDIQ